MGKGVNRARIVACALLGGVIALIFPLISGVPILSTVIKVASGLLLTLLSAKYNGAKDYFYCTITFFLLTLSTGGIVIGVMQILGLKYSTTTFVAIGFIPVLAVIKTASVFVKQMYKRRHVIRHVVQVEIMVDSGLLKANGFMDTGNNLYCNGAPVIVCGKDFAKRIIKASKTLPKTESIIVSTATETKELKAIKLQ